MAEPWLDSLSEDWKSEDHSSSPSASIVNRSSLNGGSTRSQQTRIPHLRQSLRKDSANGNYLQLRSTKGLARSKTSPVLAERTASSLNVSAEHHPKSGSEKRGSTIPRRASSVFSDSQQSVQHYTLHHRSTHEKNDTPEWKKRLARGEDVAAEGIDLFGPSKLEGVFKQPAPKQDEAGKSNTPTTTQQALWTQFNLPAMPKALEQPHTFRTSRSRRGMEVLEELSEDEGSIADLSEDGEAPRGTDSMHGFVKDRVFSLERRSQKASPEASPHSHNYRKTSAAETINDPRWRTISGQEELLNEDLSPVTVSKQNTIRDRVLKDSLDMDADDLRRKLKELNMDELRRPSSSSSDQGIEYGHQRNAGDHESREDSNLEMTAHSLPDDLSMGTQEFVSNGGYVSRRRGGYSNENSFQRKPLSPSTGSSRPHSRQPAFLASNIRSSPPPYTEARDHEGGNSRLTASVPATPSSASIVHRTENSSRPRSSGSPLKLFGNRDTYTNNKLLRVLSQFEEADSSLQGGLEGGSLLDHQPDENFRMSEFGKGDLDGFDFRQTIEREEVITTKQHDPEYLIFDTLDRPGKKNTMLSSQMPRPHARTTGSGESTDTETKKRIPNSPQKDRTPKRRRTLLMDELQIPTFQEEGKPEASADLTRLAGTKHTDSRSEIRESEVDPSLLASRSMLRPRSTKRRSSTSVQQVLNNISNTEVKEAADGTETELTQALAAELANFATGVTQAVTDSRKPSLATKDYMEEANKVMQFIRAKGKPKTSLPNIEEPTELSELDPDAILDLDIDAESTMDSFSRPPSRDGPRLTRPVPRQAQHDPRTASHLRKFKDLDELELVASTSLLGTLHLVDNQAAYEAALVPVPDEEQESSPPNMRILNSEETHRKRKHSTSLVEQPSSSHQDLLQQSQNSSGSSTQRTFPTGSSNSSGQRGVITSGTVTIPDQVGRMTFDHARKMWVKEQNVPEDEKAAYRRKRGTTSEEDPFESIPDLSIDEGQEEILKTSSQSNTVKGAKGTDILGWQDRGQHSTEPKHDEIVAHDLKSRLDLSQDPNSDSQRRQESGNEAAEAQNSLRSQVSEHELLVHNGLPSRPPKASNNLNKQPRVVTIAFSSPLVSAIKYNDEPSDIDLDEEDNLPLDDSELPRSSPVTNRATEWTQKVRDTKSLRECSVTTSDRHDQYRAMTLARRPVSRIEEREEEEEQNAEMSVVHITNPGVMTPAPPHKSKAMTVPRTGHNGTSIIALTPLSEFSLHQVDNARHLEESFVGRRANPKSLRPAHGSLALAVDDLMKAITDAEPSEIFWEQVRRLNLTGKGLKNLHGLSEYCSTLEELTIQNNQIGQLNGLPATIRSLNVQGNILSNLTSWGHLQNLQYVDVSGNQLENLDGFGSLVHLRELNASDNHVRDIDGILDLDGLLSLCLSGNELANVNFEGTELSRLTRLDLSQNHLTAIRNLQVLVSLEELDLQQNDLRGLSLPEDAVLRKLRILRLSSNQLEIVNLKHFPALEELYLDNNRMLDVIGLEEARQLKVLSLQEQTESPDIVNRVLSMPSECRDVYLSSNVVREGHLQLPKLPHYNLRHLELACCGVSTLPQGFGDFFPNCKELNLNFNAIKEISELQGMVKLEKLLLAGNRVKRLRRTCIVVARLGDSLQEWDVRENPLSVGFHAPGQGCEAVNGQYKLPDGDGKRDVKWLTLMDEVTGLKRRMMELMLAERCTRLEKLNGLPFRGGWIRETGMGDGVWDVLTGKGVLRHKAIMPAEEGEGCAGEAVETEVEGDVGEDAVVNKERSLMIE